MQAPAAPARTAPVQRNESTPPAAQPAKLPSLPTVRRGGYDTDAVDRFLRTTTAEKVGLSASLTEAQSRLRSLQAEVDALRTKVDENENPTYAGLGGRASEMLRLAEEQAAEVLQEAQAQAAQIRQQATRDAAAVKSEAEADAEDMRVVQIRELEETRCSHHCRHRGPPHPRARRGRRAPRLRQARGRAAPARRRAGDQRAAHQHRP